MYRIVMNNGADSQLIHTDAPDMPKVAAGKLREYVGTVPTLNFSILSNHPAFSEMHEKISTFQLLNTATGEAEFEGFLQSAPVKMDTSGKLKKTVNCEGYLSYLNDSVQEFYTYTDQDAQPAQFLQALLDYHNAITEESKHIYLGMVNAGQGGSKTTAYRSTLEEIKVNLISRFGGELRVRRGNDGRLYLDYLTAATNGSTSDIIVMLGHNLRSLSIESDTANIVTRLMPLGAQLSDSGDSAERLTITGAVDPDDGHTYTVPYIDDPDAIAKYGVIVGTAEFDDITVKENLVSRGKAYLAENNRVKKHYAASVLDISGKGRIRCGDTYRFRNPIMGLDENLRLLGRTVDILKPYTPEVEIGDKTAKITSVTAQTQHLINYELPNQLSQVVVTAKNIATNLIEAATTGYVIVRPNEILIMDTDNIETAHSVWRMNQGGIGYSSNGYHGPYGLAMTMNGQIVADFIAAGTMYADRIRGGTLRMGGTDNTNGVIEVADASGNIICRLDQNGADIFGQMLTRDSSGFWMQMCNGALLGGKDSSTYTHLDATATVQDDIDGRTYTYHGLRIYADAISFDNCKHIGANNKMGMTGMLSVSVHTSTLENVAVRGADGETLDYIDLTYVDAVALEPNDQVWVEKGLVTT